MHTHSLAHSLTHSLTHSTYSHKPTRSLARTHTGAEEKLQEKEKTAALELERARAALRQTMASHNDSVDGGMAANERQKETASADALSQQQQPEQQQAVEITAADLKCVFFIDSQFATINTLTRVWVSLMPFALSRPHSGGVLFRLLRLRQRHLHC